LVILILIEIKLVVATPGELVRSSKRKSRVILVFVLCIFVQKRKFKVKLNKATSMGVAPICIKYHVSE